ncbi:type II toxin-antitoxin system ParD family antitoxin [Sphingobium yanoikuyae]|uniref:Type II toxin-antitoxin system ParD family antitoxin n=1 Tax=Sphingobium yanoikuyae TaxID=13690 RepID=A0A6M4GBT9_SPHYA|nr:type II toxin-antitoxin system ParD family antitoxin [Sphingobium yanoikuyae]QJR04508.1 type II toxin-antitoxin system ParD family antitoxin [Sphingobium yanoikuyae]
MARNTSIVIGDHFSQFVSEQVRSGRYGSTSDVVRAGLRLLEEHEARLRALGDIMVADTALPFDASVQQGGAQPAASDIPPPSGV